MADDLLVRAIGGAERLMELLERERTALGRADALDLEACAAEKDVLVQELRACGIERCDDSAAGQRLQSLLAECGRRNSVNGLIIEAGQQRTRSALALLRGQTLEPALYGPGQGAPVDGASRSIAKA